MNHEYFEDLISARIDGLLTEEEEQELEAHLASCPDCRRAWREMDTVHHLLQAASPLPPEGLEDRILDALPEQPRRRSPWMKKAAPLAAAAVFLLAVVGITRTAANFHSNVNQDVVQAEAVTAEEESEEAADSAKTGGANEDKDSTGAFGKDKEETEEAEAEAAEGSADQKAESAAASAHNKNKTQTNSQSKDKKTDTSKSGSKKTDTAKAGQTKPSAAAKPAAQDTKPAAQETKPAAAQPAEETSNAAAGGGSEEARTEAAAEEAPAEMASAAAEEPAAPAPEPAASTTAAPAAAPEPEDEDPEAPTTSTITWQQARDRLDAYLDGPQDDLTALGMDNSGTHWLFSTGGKTYAVDIHTGAVSQR